MSRASRICACCDNAQRAENRLCMRTPHESGAQRRRRIADANRAERLAPSARSIAQRTAEGFRFVGFYKASQAFKRRGRMRWEPAWAEWWVG